MSDLTELVEAVSAARAAAYGDSNDDEIGYLQIALDRALELVPGWAEVNPGEPTAPWEE